MEILGCSAAGKSALVLLIVWAIDANSCNLLIDGVDCGQWNCKELGRYIGDLLQQPELCLGTIGQKIARMHDDAPSTVCGSTQNKSRLPN